jgi:hypothetical protein
MHYSGSCAKPDWVIIVANTVGLSLAAAVFVYKFEIFTPVRRAAIRNYSHE